MREAANATGFDDPLGKVHVSLGAVEVVGGDRDGIAGWRQRLRLGECGIADRGKQHGSDLPKWNGDRTALEFKDFRALPLMHYRSFHLAHDSLSRSLHLLDHSFRNDTGVAQDSHRDNGSYRFGLLFVWLRIREGATSTRRPLYHPQQTFEM
jgi:hypothetical protein